MDTIIESLLKKNLLTNQEQSRAFMSIPLSDHNYSGRHFEIYILGCFQKFEFIFS